MPRRRRRRGVRVVVGGESGEVVVGRRVLPAAVRAIRARAERDPEVHRARPDLAVARAAVVRRVVLGVEVQLHEMVALPVVAERASGLGVGEGMSGHVGRAVRQPADGERHPGLRVEALVIGRRGVERGPCLLEEHERELVRAPVVKDVGPVECRVRKRLRRAGGQHAPPVPHAGDQALEGIDDGRAQVVEDVGELVGKATGQLARELVGVGRHRGDPLLPLADELFVEPSPHVQDPLDDLADRLPPGRWRSREACRRGRVRSPRARGSCARCDRSRRRLWPRQRRSGNRAGCHRREVG